MIRRHDHGGTLSEAWYSECGSYRYALTREWQAGAPRLLWVMLNPSTASEKRNDPTVARCESRARRMECGAFRVVNLFAYRATDPRDLRRAADPAGPANNAVITDAADWADTIVCAWGAHGAWQNRGAEVEAMLRKGGHRLWHLGLTQAGHPRHPLYLPQEAVLLPWLVPHG